MAPQQVQAHIHVARHVFVLESLTTPHNRRKKCLPEIPARHARVVTCNLLWQQLLKLHRPRDGGVLKTFSVIRTVIFKKF